MDEQPRKPRVNWGSLASLAIFIIFVLARPLSNLVRQLSAGNLPAIGNFTFPWQSLLPLGIGIVALLIGAAVIARVLRVGDVGASTPMRPSLPLPRYDTRLPESPGFEPIFNPLLLVGVVVGLLLLGIIGFYILQFGI